ncbi:DUF3710 domain-containing protein [Streptomyces armeniacus]|uniref:DUF3710 domain-containing protein n=1 Tax=Streptomyces armeniacus TaxID=83291 RepID=UPI001AD83C7B|nr:DUF3710 domain-containing protein [Streptomyces armeniacus]
MAATVSLGGGAASVQLQAFAADACGGLWEQVSARMAEGLSAGGGSLARVDGPLGPEPGAVLRDVESPGGEVAVRFAGCDGPGWLLRGTFTGAAGPGERYARRLEAVFRDTVVARGHGVPAPGEPLFLTLPPAPDAG